MRLLPLALATLAAQVTASTLTQDQAITRLFRLALARDPSTDELGFARTIGYVRWVTTGESRTNFGLLCAAIGVKCTLGNAADSAQIAKEGACTPSTQSLQ